MRIYAVADIHAVSERITRIRAGIGDHSPDVLIVAGDIVNYTHNERLFREIDSLEVPVLAVRGNSDPYWHERRYQRYPNITSLHLNKVDIGGFSFTGIGGTLPVPFRSRFRLLERRLLENIKRLLDRRTVLVVHPPPHGTLDRVMGRFSAGAKGVCELMDHCRPPLVLCGHIHEDAGAICVGQTLVVNCSMGRDGNGAIIDLDGSHPPVARMI